MDSDIRQIERQIKAGDLSLIPKYVSLKRKFGSNVKLKPGFKQEIRAALRQNRSGTYEAVVIKRAIAARGVLLSQKGCQHNHKQLKQAKTCLKRQIYKLIISDHELLRKYIVLP